MAHNARPTILVVDDEPAILDALEDLLEDNFRVLKATSGRAGLALLEQNTVSVVLSDQKMPGMKGEEFLAKVAEGHVTTRVLLTGYTDFEDLVRAVNRGHIYAFVSKPWSPHQLRSLVRAAAERFELERELLHEKNLLGLLLENSPDLISIKDRQGRYLRLNKACAKALGSEDTKAPIGKTDQQLGGSLFAEAPAREQAILDGGPADTDLTEKAVRGPHWYSTTRVATPSSDGPRLLIGISREITERLESSRRLQEHARQLERLNEELSRVSFVVAHHLQEPLRSIGGFTDLLARRSLLKKGAEEYLAFISESVHRARSLMRDFSLYLDLHQATDKRSLSLAEAATASIVSLSSEYHKMPVSLRGEATIWGHKELITQLFRALIDNALVHGQSGQEVIVEIGGGALGDAGKSRFTSPAGPSSDGQVLVTIDDQGPGIPDEAHTLVFRLFETLESGARSGLGLALCQKIVELHGGQIWLERSDRGGLRVNLTLAIDGRDKASPALPPEESSLKDISALRDRMARLEAFSATAAHDLQEPLRMIKSYLSLLQRREAKALSEEGREFLHFTLEGSERMKALIDSLLAYSISGQGRGDQAELATVLEEVLADLQVAVSETRAEIEIGELPSLKVNAVEGRQLFSNLLGNALKYRSEAPLRVTVTVEPQDRQTWLVTVSDNGIGVPAERQQTIFEPFVRGDHDRTYRGAGLGLATCRRIVSGWGGSLWHEAGEDGGSRFRFTLPLT